MEGSTVETPQPSQSETSGNTPVNPPELNQRHEAASRLGRSFLAILKEREDGRLTPYVDLTKFDRTDMAAISNRRDGSISEPDVQEAKRGSLAIALETATQIAEVQLPRTSGVRENLGNLEDLTRMLRGTAVGIQQLIRENPAMVAGEMRKVVARRLKVLPIQVRLTDQQLTTLAGEQYQKAFGRIFRASQAIAGYHGR